MAGFKTNWPLKVRGDFPKKEKRQPTLPLSNFAELPIAYFIRGTTSVKCDFVVGSRLSVNVLFDVPEPFQGVARADKHPFAICNLYTDHPLDPDPNGSH